MKVNLYNDSFPNELGSPVFYHKPHGDSSNGIISQVHTDFIKLYKRVVANKDSYMFTPPENILFLTYNNRLSVSPIENCYKAYNIPHVVLAQHEKKWDWMVKINSVLEYLQKNEIEQEYILATDANDVIMVNDPKLIIEFFEFYECGILFCNTNADWPANEKYKNFESLKYYTHQFHSHLSAGGYIARKEILIGYLEEIVSRYKKNDPELFFRGRFDDQLSWRSLHFRDYPKIKVDFRSLIFKRFDLFRNLDQEYVTINQ